jgi:hypothetical protein
VKNAKKWCKVVESGTKLLCLLRRKRQPLRL